MNAPSLNPDWTSLPIFDRSRWQHLCFGEFAQSINERIDPSEAAEDVYVGLEHLDPESLRIRRWGKGSDVIGTKLRFQKGDIIFGRRRAYQRKLAVAEFDGICSAHAMVVRANPNVVLPEFLPFLMISDRFMNRAVEISVGSLSPTINWKTLKQEEFALPPLDQQRRIAEILWASDEVIAKMFEAEEDAETLVTAELNHFLYHDANWMEVRCSDLLAEGPRNGFSPPASSDVGGIPTLSISAIRGGKVVPEGSLKYVDINSELVSQFELHSGDILVVRGNGNRLLCARAGIVEDFPDGCFYPDLLIRVRFRPDYLLPDFAVMEWNEPKTHSRLLRKAKSTNGIFKINGEDIRSHVLVVPPINEQKRFLQRLETRKEVSEYLHKSATAAVTLRSCLINSLLS